MKWLRDYKYKNLTLFFISIALAIFLSRYDFLNNALFNSRQIPFLGSFIAGMLYISASTTALGILILSDLSKTISPIQIAVVAGIGGAVADFALFRFLRGNIFLEINPIYNKLGGRHLTKLMCRKYLRWSLPIIGAIIIASPFPDEIGIGMMGLSHIKTYQFVLLCLVLDIAGVFLLTSTFSLIK